MSLNCMKTSVIKNWLGRKRLQLLETLTQAEKKKIVKHLKDFSKH